MAIYFKGKQVAVNYIDNSTLTTSTLNVTSNGTYNASSGNAYNKVVVSVNAANNNLVQSVLRPDAELIISYSGDYLAVEDKNITITKPYDTTSRTVLAAGGHFKTTTSTGITIDRNAYDYYVLTRCITIPQYSVNTVGTGRMEYQILVGLYQMYNLPGNSLTALINNTAITADNITFTGMIYPRSVYWTSGTALSFYAAYSYGAIQSPSTPSVSSNKLIINSPAIIIRGHASYFSETYYNALTDIAAQYKIDVYRAPKNHLAVDGWGLNHQVEQLINCMNTNQTII